MKCSVCLIKSVVAFFSFLGIGYPNTSIAQREIKPCQQEPSFIRTLGFDPLWTALSTSEKMYIGISLVAFEKKAGQSAPTPQTPKMEIYQHPSWKKAGYLSTISFDRLGNAYTVPAPLISMLYNETEKLNTIYKIEASNGEMTEWIKLPFAAKPSPQNPYGLLGINYDCQDHFLVASTVAGSNRYNEQGVIYLIDPQNKKPTDSITRFDAMGLGFGLDELSKKRLYYGSTRNGNIYSIVVSAKGKMDKKTIRKELSLEGYGPRGDDKARKIKFNGNQLLVSGTAFNYNLQAASEKPETLYTFIWLAKEKKWGLINYN